MVEEETGGKAGLLANVSEKIIRALPPAFLLLVLLNIVFLAVSAWTFQHNSDMRGAMISKIVEACLLERRERNQ